MFGDLFKESNQRKRHPGVNKGIDPKHDARNYYYCMFNNIKASYFYPVVCIIEKDEWDNNWDINDGHAYLNPPGGPFFMGMNGFIQLTYNFYEYDGNDDPEVILQRIGLEFNRDLEKYVEDKYK